jgi:hypothetical protein
LPLLRRILVLPPRRRRTFPGNFRRQRISNSYGLGLAQLESDLERLHVGSLPSLGALDYVKLHGLTFLQTLEAAGVDRRVMYEDILPVLTRDEAKALRVIKPLHSTLFHLIVFPGLNCA